MLLENKVAVIYGGGAISGAVARGFAAEGARLFVAGRNQAKLEEIAAEVEADVRVLDALDESAVDAFVDGVVEQAGQIDISFNVVGYGDIQQPLMEISVEDFLQPIQNAMRTQFLTARAVARHMIKRGSGVILHFGGGGPQTLHSLGGFKIALDAIEGLRRQWVMELGQYGIRVVTLKTGGIPESLPSDFDPVLRERIVAGLEEPTLLRRTATLQDVADVAAFVASNKARTLTSTEVNISCGAIVD